MQIRRRKRHTTFSFLLVIGSQLIAACGADTSTSDFRSDDRPDYDRRMSVEDIPGILDSGGTVLDVRLKEDFQADPVLIPNALYRDPELMTEWVSELDDIDGPVVVYCVRGKWVSQKVAHQLKARGIEVYSLEGGIEAWQAEGRETVSRD